MTMTLPGWVDTAASFGPGTVKVHVGLGDRDSAGCCLPGCADWTLMLTQGCSVPQPGPCQWLCVLRDLRAAGVLGQQLR